MPKKKKKSYVEPQFVETTVEEEHAAYLLTLLVKESNPAIDAGDAYPIILDLVVNECTEEDFIRAGEQIRATSKLGGSKTTH